jgi:hypothetical protein
VTPPLASPDLVDLFIQMERDTVDGERRGGYSSPKVSMSQNSGGPCHELRRTGFLACSNGYFTAGWTS